MQKCLGLVLLFLLLCFSTESPGIGAESTAAIVARAKAATGVLSAGTKIGTAFCIDPAGYFITSLSTIRLHGSNMMTVILQRGEAGEKMITVRNVVSDLASDLAILKATTPQGLPALELGEGSSLSKDQKVAALGYPLSERLPDNTRSKPPISVLGCTIVEIDKRDGAIESLQLSAEFSEGLTGGPVINREGKVVGIISAPKKGSSERKIASVDVLNDLLTTPLLIFSPNVITEENAHSEQTFKAQSGWLLPSTKRALRLELEIEGLEKEVLRIPMTYQDGEFTANAVPIPRSTKAEVLLLTAQLPIGEIKGEIIDFSFRLDDKELRLGDVRALIPLEDGSLRALIFNTSKTGKPSGLNNLIADLGQMQIPLDVFKSKAILVKRQNEKSSTTVSVVALVDEQEKSRVTYYLATDKARNRDPRRSHVLSVISDSLGKPQEGLLHLPTEEKSVPAPSPATNGKKPPMKETASSPSKR